MTWQMPELMDKNLSSPPDLNQMQFDNYRDERQSEQVASGEPYRRRSLVPSLLVLLLLIFEEATILYFLEYHF